jgi:RNA polymerase sigma-70 factor (ECF subfamily)
MLAAQAGNSAQEYSGVPDSNQSQAPPGDPSAGAASIPGFDEVYETHFDFVWRSVRRLGVPERQIDDAVQDVFLVVHRRLSDFEGRSSIRTWLFGIALRVARDHRRSLSRRGNLEQLDEQQIDGGAASPDERTARSQALLLLERFLARLDEDKRAVFILAELEEMTAPEIGEALGVNVNTVYSRLRAARKAFDEAVKRHLAQENAG